jgi:hypothetical protein
MPPQLYDIEWFDLTAGVFEERMVQLIAILRTREMG